jgi:hypothetical protein
MHGKRNRHSPDKHQPKPIHRIPVYDVDNAMKIKNADDDGVGWFAKYCVGVGIGIGDQVAGHTTIRNYWIVMVMPLRWPA